MSGTSVAFAKATVMKNVFYLIFTKGHRISQNKCFLEKYSSYFGVECALANIQFSWIYV
jgi:hypothetical protein